MKALFQATANQFFISRLALVEIPFQLLHVSAKFHKTIGTLLRRQEPLYKTYASLKQFSSIL